MFGFSFDPVDLKVGMTREDVIHRYGRPARAHASPRSEALFYDRGWPWMKSTTVFLENGKVGDWRYD